MADDLEDALAQLFSRAGSGQSGGGIFGALVPALAGVAGGAAGGGAFGAGAGAGLTSFGLTGFQHGGSFTVGGTGGIDRNLVAFRATRGERVTIDPAGVSEERGGGNTFYIDNSNSTAESYAELKRALFEAAGPGKVEQRAVAAVVGRRRRNPDLFK